MTRPTGIVAASIALLALLGASSAQAQMYTNGPGFYMSLEGRSLQNSGDGAKLSPPADTDKDSTRNSGQAFDDKGFDKAWGGKAALDYRFQNNWDIGVSASGLKNAK